MTAMFSPGAPAIAASPGFPVTRQAANAPSYRSALDALRWRLFNQGQDGVIYLPRPDFLGRQLLFQDSAGTTPVTADGQPVGLMLDLHKGLVLGPELVTNGTFDTDTSGWSAGVGTPVISWVDGTIEVFGDADNEGAVQGFPTEVGKYYLVSGELIDNGTGGWIIKSDSPTSFTTSRINVTASTSDIGFNSAIIEATAATTYIHLLNLAAGTTGKYDNISVRELPGNHATQATAASKPLYRTDGVRPRVESDGVDDLLQAVYSAPVVPPCVLSIAINRRLINSATVIVTGLDGATRHQLSFNGAGFLIAAAGGTGLVSDATVSEGKHVVTLVLNGANSQIRLDGAVVQTGSLPNVAATGLSLSSVWDGTGAAQQDVYGAIHAEGIDEVDAIEQYLASVSGAIL